MFTKRYCLVRPWSWLTRHVVARRRLAFLALWTAALVASGCATQPMPQGYDPPGFWMGLFHGFTIVFSLIGSIFTDCRIYAFPNSGGWYDFGYVLGAGAFLGGSGASSH